MVTDFDEKHDEYLVLLQQRNRILKRLRRKDSTQIKLEQLERGFTLYVNGANSELRNCTKRANPQNLIRRGAQTARGNAAFADALLKEDVQRRGTQTAPGKIQRREWLQKAVQIKTESGSQVRVAPPFQYSEDFETYESLELEPDKPGHDGPSQSLEPPERLVPSDAVLSDPEAEFSMSSRDGGKAGLHLSDEEELRRSLEATGSGYWTEEDCLEGDDSDSVEEDVPVEHSEAEEPPGGGTALSLSSAAPSPASGRRGSPRGASPPTVLELKLGFTTVKKERSLSAKRKAAAEAYVPTRPASRAESLRPEEQDRALSRPGSRSGRPLSAARKAVCEKKDPAQAASVVLRAVREENEGLQREVLWKRPGSEPERAVSAEVLLPSASGACAPPARAQEEAAASTAAEVTGLLGSRHPKKLLEVLQGVESQPASGAPAEQPEPGVTDQLEVRDAIYLTVEILSNWGDATRVGLTEVEFFDLRHRKLFVSPHDVDLR